MSSILHDMNKEDPMKDKKVGLQTAIQLQHTCLLLPSSNDLHPIIPKTPQTHM